MFPKWITILISFCWLYYVCVCTITIYIEMETNESMRQEFWNKITVLLFNCSRENIKISVGYTVETISYLALKTYNIKLNKHMKIVKYFWNKTQFIMFPHYIHFSIKLDRLRTNESTHYIRDYIIISILRQ